MKTILASTALLLTLTACDVPVATNAECDRHHLSADEHADCVAKLQSSEKELRKAK